MKTRQTVPASAATRGMVHSKPGRFVTEVLTGATSAVGAVIAGAVAWAMRLCRRGASGARGMAPPVLVRGGSVARICPAVFVFWGGGGGVITGASEGEVTWSSDGPLDTGGSVSRVGWLGTAESITWVEPWLTSGRPITVASVLPGFFSLTGVSDSLSNERLREG